MNKKSKADKYLFLYASTLQTFDFVCVWSGGVCVGGWVNECSLPLQVLY